LGDCGNIKVYIACRFTKHENNKSDIKYKIRHQETYSNGNMEAIKLVLDALTVLPPENVDLVLWAIGFFGVFVNKCEGYIK
jgi:hypothetical protein